jgi:N-acetylneuraminic acid mutarotase
LTFDPTEHRFILHGGNLYPTGSVVSDTWSFSIATQQWTKLTTSGDAPPVRYCHCATYLPGQKQVLIAGGRDSGGLVDSAYTLDLQTLAWTRVAGPVPTGAIGCNAHWMPNLSRAIVFGGEGMSGVNDRTWSYDPTTRAFTELMPAVRPHARRDAMSIYEPTQGRMFVFGGAVAITQQYLDDVAVFDGSNWLDTPAPTPHPVRRRYGASGYDALHARWVLFSGTNDVDDFDDLWVIDPVTFDFVQAPSVGPVKRGFAASGIDEVTGTLYVFGGLTTPGFEALADGWTLRLTLE